MTKTHNCIAPELKYMVVALYRAGVRPKVIHELLTNAGERISIRYVYKLCGRV